MIVTLILIFAASAFIYFRYLTSSGDIELYRRYYINDCGTPSGGGVKVTFLGTTSLLLDDGDTQLMTDGFLTRPSLWKVATSKISTDKAVVDAVFSRLKIDRLKGLFVSHSHYDHAFDIAYVIKKTNAKLYGSKSTLNIGIGGGLRADRMVLYEPGKDLHFGKFTVTILNSKHSPAKSFNDDIGQMITAPLVQPAKAREYHEGGSYDILIKHGEHTILIKPSANYVTGALDNVKADVVFLSTGTLGIQDAKFKNAYYDQTIGKVKPKLVIPIHWDNFFVPLSDHLEATIKAGDNLPNGFEFVIGRTKADGIEFRILQGYQSVSLFS
jgi:L-ascorbate metabolism protein UlaG (beta-lactamase superfamily)